MDIHEVTDMLKEAFGDLSGDQIADVFNKVVDQQIHYLGDSEWELTGKLSSDPLPEFEILKGDVDHPVLRNHLHDVVADANMQLAQHITPEVLDNFEFESRECLRPLYETKADANMQLAQHITPEKATMVKHSLRHAIDPDTILSGGPKGSLL